MPITILVRRLKGSAGTIAPPPSGWTTVNTFDDSTYNTQWTIGNYAPAGNFANTFDVSGGFVSTLYRTWQPGIPSGVNAGAAVCEITPNSHGSYNSPYRVPLTWQLSSATPYQVGGTLNKIYFTRVNGSNIFFLYVIGGTPMTDPPVIGIGIQGAVVTPGGQQQYDSSFVVTHGVTRTFTVILTPNTASTADGTAQLWVNTGDFDPNDLGTQILNLTGIQWVAGAASFTETWIQPSWGTSGGVPSPGGFSHRHKQLLVQIPT
jgi:hypothetical protein